MLYRSILALCVLAAPALAADPAPIDIAGRRELFVDHLLIDRMTGTELRLHHPQSAGSVLRFDQPWEGVFCAYVTVLKDADVYRMYYRGLPDASGGEAAHGEREVTCYAESRDGIRWTKPELGLFEVRGSRANNVILVRSPACHNFSPFVDTRPGIEAAQRYKALGGTGKGLLAFVSADGIRWKPVQEGPVFTKGAFDSQNLAFWSASENCYVCYFRSWKKFGSSGHRWISRTTSKDFVTWADPVEMQCGDVPPEDFYTNQTQTYFRAPHLYVSIFARFMPGRQVLSPEDAKRLGVVGDYFHDCSDVCFMTSRGGDRYARTFMEGFVRPGLGLANWTSRTNYPALGVVPTSDAEMSIYVQREYAQPSHHLERLVLRPDGFVSVNAPYRGGEMVTKPILFAGPELTLNMSASAAGQVQVEIQDSDGNPIEGFALADAKPVLGDHLARVAMWKNGSDTSRLAGKPVRLRFVMKDADLYAIQFR